MKKSIHLFLPTKQKINSSPPTRPILPLSCSFKQPIQIKRTQDYSIRLETNQKDEFSKLAISINELLDYIEKEKNRDQEKQKILQAQAEKDGQITLGFLDIDHFKDFNTYFGHQVGDKVLQFVSAVLKEQLKGKIGRVGGDEFIFCFVGKKR